MLPSKGLLKYMCMEQIEFTLRDFWMMIIQYQAELEEEGCLMLIPEGLLEIQW